MKTILVTGANGFIGSQVCQKFIKKNYNVFGLVRKTSSLKFLKNIPIPLLFADISNLKNLIQSVNPLKKIDWIIHIAGLASDWGDYETFYNANVQGTMNILKLAQKKQTEKVIIFSSLSVMGFNHIQATEETKPTPLNVNYVLSKKEMEVQALNFAKEHNLPITILRPGDVYGENDRTTTLQLFSALEKGQMGFINSGKAKLSPLYIDNLFQVILLSLKNKKSNFQAYNVTDNISITWKKYISLICSALKIPLPKLNLPYGLAYFLAFLLEIFYKILKIKTAPPLTRYRIKHAGLNYDFNIPKLITDLNYKPNRNIAQNIKKTAQWYIKNKSQKQKILITGISGLWGYNLARYFASLSEKYELYGTYNKNKVTLPYIKTQKIDLTKKTSVQTLVNNIKPDIIIHTAANSKVKNCEKNPNLAKKINVKSVEYLVEISNLYKSKLIFFSTDLVYSGKKAFYKESDPLKPINTYEKTKAMAEEYIKKHSYHYIILRTALSYGAASPFHFSFIDWIINSVKKKQKVFLFTDQYRTPMATYDGVRAIETMIQKDIKNTILNFGGKEKINRYDFGLQLAKIFKLDTKFIIPTTYAKIQNVILPSKNTAMDISNLKKIYKPHSIQFNLSKLKKLRNN